MKGNMTIMEVRYAPSDTRSARMAVFAVTSQADGLRCHYTGEVFAFRFYDVEEGAGILFAKECPHLNQTGWYFTHGNRVALSNIQSMRVVRETTVQYHRRLGNMVVVLIQDMEPIFLSAQDFGAILTPEALEAMKMKTQ